VVSLIFIFYTYCKYRHRISTFLYWINEHLSITNITAYWRTVAFSYNVWYVWHISKPLSSHTKTGTKSQTYWILRPHRLLLFNNFSQIDETTLCDEQVLPNISIFKTLNNVLWCLNLMFVVNNWKKTFLLDVLVFQLPLLHGNTYWHCYTARRGKCQDYTAETHVGYNWSVKHFNWAKEMCFTVP
jgi:hypothetical protein